ncbi:hypothetical protein FH5_02143 [Priestia endophytica]|nr:hypothetical protein FH5_02143 [Priestia endophytica]
MISFFKVSVGNRTSRHGVLIKETMKDELFSFFFLQLLRIPD